MSTSPRKPIEFRKSQKQLQAPDLLEAGLPVSTEIERFIIGSVFVRADRYSELASQVFAEDFQLERNRRMWERMGEINERGAAITEVLLYQELQRHSEAEADTLSYMMACRDGVPDLGTLKPYIDVLKEKTAQRKLIYASKALYSKAALGEDVQDTIAEMQETLIGIGSRKAAGGLMSPEEIIRGAGGINSFLDPSKRVRGTPTGFTRFDEMTGGLRPGEMTILAARPGVGKSTIAVNIAWNVATRQFLPVAIFSFEMSRESLLTRMVCAAARVDSARFRAGYVSDYDRQKLRAAVAQLVESPIYIDDTPGSTPLDIKTKIRRIEQKTGNKITLGVIDYLQLMEGKGENRNQQVSYLSRSMKLLSKDEGLHLFVLSQLSRAPEARQGDKRPQLNDLRESGSLEQDCDVAAFLYREELHHPEREDLKGKAELILRKQRDGATGTIDLIFLGPTNRFENPAGDEIEPLSGNTQHWQERDN